MSGPPDPRAVLDQPTLEVARDLLGWRLVRDDGSGRRVGRIVELEAYIGERDRASHARFGRTARNEVMYGLPGRAYVYLVYGMHDCLNIVTEPTGSPAALLVRAVEPLEGIERMRASRAERTRIRRRAPSATRWTADARIAAGPGLVCAAFDLGRGLTGHDLFDPAGPVRLEPPPAGEAAPSIVAGPRVGIGYAGTPWTEVPWRLSIAGHPSASRPLPHPAG
ncbi:MAG TPA: DNA-3-methyladenine glycosylase [Patescibacteria group bacterium]|nr:DNA-3-methyladenine glycosylase [Patescibacteria group bacterium]